LWSDMFGELYERAGSRTDGRGGEWIDVCGMEWSGLHRNGYVFGDHECR